MTELTGNTLQGPPVAGDETATLLGSLERQRATFAWKAGGLDAAGLRATVGVSSMTLGGLIKHLALVEDDYFSRRLHGRQLGAPWAGIDWDADPDWEWRTGAEDGPERLYALWQAAVERSRASVAEAPGPRPAAAPARARRGGGGHPGRRAGGRGGHSHGRRPLRVAMTGGRARPPGPAALARGSAGGLSGAAPPSGWAQV